MKLDRFGNVAEVGSHADAHALGGEGVAHRVHRVVRDAEAFDLQVTDRKRGAGLKCLEARRRRFAPVDRGRGEPGHVNHRPDAAIARQHWQPGHVVGVLMGDEDGVDIGKLFADGREALPQLAHAQPGVQQDARVRGRHQRGVAGAATRQHAEFDRVAPPDLQNTPKKAKTG